MIKELKSGYTTGSCAAAGAKAALELILGTTQKNVKIDTLNGEELNIPIYKSKKIGNNSATVVILKDAGDDPDVTNGIEICTRIKIIDKLPLDKKAHIYNNILITGGKGVGISTKKGLKVEIGKYAINPGPQQMIIKAIENLIPKNKKVIVKIFVPKGREKSKKTFNERLGVIGGISILGTTGIVKPMSEDALKNSMSEELKVLKENSKKDWIVFVFGNHGKEFCEKNKIVPEQMIIISNYIGFMIDSAVKYGYKRILLIGHIGKAIKIAGGIFNTHSRIADARLEIFASNAVMIDESRENILKILRSNTVEEACEYIDKKEEFFSLIGNKIVMKCEEYSRGTIKFQVALFDYKGNILGHSEEFYKFLEELKKDE